MNDFLIDNETEPVRYEEKDQEWSEDPHEEHKNWKFQNYTKQIDSSYAKDKKNYKFIPALKKNCSKRRKQKNRRNKNKLCPLQLQSILHYFAP